MDIFLRAKHWQLFVIIYVIPIIFVIVMMISVFASVFQNDQPDPLVIFRYFRFIPVISLFSVAGKLGWEWAVGIRLQRFAPPGVVFKNTAFKIFLLVIVLYYIAIFIFIFSMVDTIIPMMKNSQEGPGPAFFIGLACVVPLAFAAVFGQFYCYYFAAKTYKTAEQQRNMSFGDFVLEFVLIWFFFVGVWILQPKINQLIGTQGTPGEPVQ